MTLDLARRAVLIDMAYEIGGQGLAQFQHLLSAIRAAEWDKAAAALQSSLLFQQVPSRERSNYIILLTGELPPGITDAQGLVKLHEGCTLVALPDAKGKYEIGYGHDISPPQGGISAVCTEADAESWFQQDFSLAEERARSALGAEYW